MGTSKAKFQGKELKPGEEIVLSVKLVKEEVILPEEPAFSPDLIEPEIQDNSIDVSAETIPYTDVESFLVPSTEVPQKETSTAPENTKGFVQSMPDQNYESNSVIQDIDVVSFEEDGEILAKNEPLPVDLPLEENQNILSIEDIKTENTQNDSSQSLIPTVDMGEVAKSNSNYFILGCMVILLVSFVVLTIIATILLFQYL